MQFFDAERVHTLLDYPGLIDALGKAHHHDVDVVPSAMMEQPADSGDSAWFLALPAWQKDKAIGAKLITVFPDNENNGSGLPSVQGVYVMFEGVNGEPAAVIDGTALTLRKTAADSALGTQLLANQDPQTMLMVGAGALGPHLIMAHTCARPSIKNVLVWNRTPARAERLSETLNIDGVTITAVEDIEAAARDADLISCATMATAPLIQGRWLKDGAHLDLVGSYREDMHECDELTMVRGSVFTDSPWSAVNDCGEITSALRSGALALEDIKGDHFSLMRGDAAGRQSTSEITIFENGGGGHLDLMVAQYLNKLGQDTKPQ